MVDAGDARDSATPGDEQYGLQTTISGRQTAGYGLGLLACSIRFDSIGHAAAGITPCLTASRLSLTRL
jgi:hypothetical protein